MAVPLTHGGPPQLTLELIPKPQANLNLRNALPETQWRALRKGVIAAADGICGICRSDERRLQCHEAWSFDDKTRTQTLVDLVAICWLCHETKHLNTGGEWGVKDSRVFEAHLAKVNGWTRRQTTIYVEREFARLAFRSRCRYHVDLSHALGFGVKPLPFYDDEHLDWLDDDLDRFIAKAWRESRRSLVAVFKPRHADRLDLYRIVPATRSRTERAALIAAFASMRHRRGNLVGHYDRHVTVEAMSAEIRTACQRRTGS